MSEVRDPFFDFFSNAGANTVGTVLGAFLIWAGLQAWLLGRAAFKQGILAPPPPAPVVKKRRGRAVTKQDQLQIRIADFKQSMRLLSVLFSCGFVLSTVWHSVSPPYTARGQILGWLQILIYGAITVWVYRDDWTPINERLNIKMPTGYRLAIRLSRWLVPIGVVGTLGIVVYFAYFDPEGQRLAHEVVEAQAAVDKANADKARLDHLQSELQWLRSLHPTTTTAPATQP